MRNGPEFGNNQSNAEMQKRRLWAAQQDMNLPPDEAVRLVIKLRNPIYNRKGNKRDRRYP